MPVGHLGIVPLLPPRDEQGVTTLAEAITGREQLHAQITDLGAQILEQIADVRGRLDEGAASRWLTRSSDT